MGPATEQVHQTALALPEDERHELVEALPASHAPLDDPPFDAAWLTEVRRRFAEVESGAVRPDAWSIVRERVRRRLEG